MHIKWIKKENRKKSLLSGREHTIEHCEISDISYVLRVFGWNVQVLVWYNEQQNQ
jgi:hypothetical protein